LQDSARSLKHAHDQLADCRKANEALQRELEESAAEQRTRLHQLKQQYMQSQQELLSARSEAHESMAHSSLHHAQLRQVWQTCQLLHRACTPCSRASATWSGRKTSLRNSSCSTRRDWRATSSTCASP
jgi:chromosome segregation ATPase